VLPTEPFHLNVIISETNLWIDPQRIIGVMSKRKNSWQVSCFNFFHLNVSSSGCKQPTLRFKCLLKCYEVQVEDIYGDF
jgi:hypothetical protein